MSEGWKRDLAFWTLAVVAYYGVIVSIPMLLVGSFVGPHVLIAGAIHLAIGIASWVACAQLFSKISD